MASAKWPGSAAPRATIYPEGQAKPHPVAGNRGQRDANSMRERGQRTSILLPQMAQEGAESLGFDNARQRDDLVERDAGRSRCTRGGMDVRLLQAQAQRC